MVCSNRRLDKGSKLEAPRGTRVVIFFFCVTCVDGFMLRLDAEFDYFNFCVTCWDLDFLTFIVFIRVTCVFSSVRFTVLVILGCLFLLRWIGWCFFLSVDPLPQCHFASISIICVRCFLEEDCSAVG